MALTFRDTKGSPLTAAEADANIRQLAGNAVKATAIYIGPSSGQISNPGGQYFNLPFGGFDGPNGLGLVLGPAPGNSVTVPEAGVYQLAASLVLRETNAAYQLLLKINDATKLDVRNAGSLAGYTTAGIPARVLSLPAGAVLTFALYFNAAATIETGPSFSTVNLIKIG